MASKVGPRQRKQEGQTKKGDEASRQNPSTTAQGPLEMLMDMFGLLMPMEDPAGGVTQAAKGPTAAGFTPDVTNRNANAQVDMWGPDGSYQGGSPQFQPMAPADINMAAEQMNQAGDMAQQGATWDPFKGSVPNVGGGFLPSQRGTPEEIAIEQAQSVPQAGPKQPVGVPAPNMPLPGRAQVDDREMALAQAGQGQFGVGPWAKPVGQNDPIIELFRRMAGGGM
jgi:hypothetical protein